MMDGTPMKPFVCWLTGLPSAGKSTLAGLLHHELLVTTGRDVEVLDGDVVRTHLSKGLGFSKDDRDTNIRRIGWVCRTLAKHGVSSIVAAVSPYRSTRDEVRLMVEQVAGAGAFLEVWLKCPLDVCMQRDVKGLYRKASRGDITQLTGVSDPYEEPASPELIVETDKEPPKESAAKILRLIQSSR